jgi:hypothetical protein
VQKAKAAKVAKNKQEIIDAILDKISKSGYDSLTKEEQEEYDNAKTDEELAELCIKDCKMRGAVLQKREVI